MALSIYHNPRCSKSRATLGLIKEANAEHTVILYLDDTPDAAKILEIASNLGLAVAALLRRGETEFATAKDLPELSDDAALAVWIAAHPIVLQRPIVVDSDSGKAIIGRPPENVQQLLP